MADVKRKRAGGMRKYGRCLRKNSKQMYKARDQRRRNKEKRIAQSNGMAAVRAWRRFSGATHRQGEVLSFPRVKRNLPAPHNSSRAYS